MIEEFLPESNHMVAPGRAQAVDLLGLHDYCARICGRSGFRWLARRRMVDALGLQQSRAGIFTPFF